MAAPRSSRVVGRCGPCKTAFVAADSQPLVVVGFSLRGLWWVFCPEVGGACSMPRDGTQLHANLPAERRSMSRLLSKAQRTHRIATDRDITDPGKRSSR